MYKLDNNDYNKNMILDLLDVLFIKKEISNEIAKEILVKHKIIRKTVSTINVQTGRKTWFSPPYHYIRISKRGAPYFVNLNFTEEEAAKFINSMV